MVGLLSAIERYRQRLTQLKERVLVGEFAGAAGTLASLQKGAMALAKLCDPSNYLGQSGFMVDRVLATLR